MKRRTIAAIDAHHRKMARKGRGLDARNRRRALLDDAKPYLPLVRRSFMHTRHNERGISPKRMRPPE